MKIGVIKMPINSVTLGKSLKITTISIPNKQGQIIYEKGRLSSSLFE